MVIIDEIIINLSLSLKKNEFLQMDLYHVLGQIYIKNISSAYLAPASKLDVILRRSEMMVNGQNAFYVLNEKVGECISLKKNCHLGILNLCQLF